MALDPSLDKRKSLNCSKDGEESPLYIQNILYDTESLASQWRPKSPDVTVHESSLTSSSNIKTLDSQHTVRNHADWAQNESYQMSSQRLYQTTNILTNMQSPSFLTKLPGSAHDLQESVYGNMSEYQQGCNYSNVQSTNFQPNNYQEICTQPLKSVSELQNSYGFTTGGHSTSPTTWNSSGQLSQPSKQLSLNFDTSSVDSKTSSINHFPTPTNTVLHDVGIHFNPSNFPMLPSIWGRLEVPDNNLNYYLTRTPQDTSYQSQHSTGESLKRKHGLLSVTIPQGSEDTNHLIYHPQDKKQLSSSRSSHIKSHSAKSPPLMNSLKKSSSPSLVGLLRKTERVISHELPDKPRKSSSSTAVNKSKDKPTTSHEVMSDLEISDVDPVNCLVSPTIRGHAPDHVYIAFAQMKVCYLTEDDIIGKNRKLPLGLPGLCCKYCGGSPGCGRYFPSTFNSFLNGTNPDRIVAHVGHICTLIPSAIREKIQELERKYNDHKPAGLRYGSRKHFFAYIWSRFHEKVENITNTPLSCNREINTDFIQSKLLVSDSKDTVLSGSSTNLNDTSVLTSKRCQDLPSIVGSNSRVKISFNYNHEDVSYTMDGNDVNKASQS